MSFFITETTEEAPCVLVIAEPSSLVRSLENFIEKKGLRSEIISPADITKTPLQKNYYKIIIVLKAWSGGEQRVVEFLHSRSENKVFLFQTVTSLSTENILWKEWVNSSAFQEKNLEYWLSVFSTASFFIAQDILDSYVVAVPPLTWLIQSVEERTLLSADLSLSLQTPAAFFQEVKKDLLAPGLQKKIIVQGQPQKIIAIVENLKKEFLETHNVSMKIVEVQVVEGLNRRDFEKKTSSTQEIAEILTKVVHSRHVKPEKIIESTISIPKVSPPVVSATSARFVPIHVPVIDNRLKKFEQKKKQLSYQKKANHFLNHFAAPITLKNTPTQLPEAHKDLPIKEKLIDETLHEMFGKQRVEQKVTRVKRLVKTTVRLEKKNHRKTLVVAGGTLLLGVSALVVLAFSVFMGTRAVIITQVTSQQSNSASSPILLHSSKFLALQINMYQLVLGSTGLPESLTLASIGQEVYDANDATTRLQRGIEDATQQFLGKNSGNMSSILSNITTTTSELYKNLSILQAQLQPANFTSLSDDNSRLLVEYSSQLQEKRKLLANAQQLEQILPGLLSQQGRKNYVVLLQNNEELRPTGGFLHAFAWVTLENGVLIDYQVFDIASTEALFQGSVQPPADLQKYLGQLNWSLHDANWSPSFPQSAEQISLFIEKSLGKKADGMIALNLTTLQSLLRDFGPVTLTDYNDVVTDKNLRERVFAHAEGMQTQKTKQDYLTALFSKVLAEVSNVPLEKSGVLLSDLYAGLRSNQVFMIFSEKEQNAVLSRLGWLGDVTTPQCPVQLSDVPCIVDSTMQVEANVGANQANHTIDRAIEEVISVTRQKVTHRRVITYKNTGTSNSLAQGSYKNYVRFFVPVNAVLQDVVIDGSPVLPQNISLSREGDKQYFGVFVEVPIQKTVSVQVTYSENLNQNAAFSYTFFDQKQAGMGDDPLKITIQVADPSLHALLIEPQATVNTSGIHFSAVRDKHIFVGVKFQ